MLSAVQSYIRKQRLLQPGDRVGMAVSGGADSVALLLALVEIGAEFGITLSVAHFNHGIRGAESDADARFAEELAKRHKLDFFLDSGDALSRAKASGESLETAARELRYGFFRDLMNAGKLDKIALAHTLDDQAETVLMRFLRGAGTRGLAGVYPEKSERGGKIVRPFLETRRAAIEGFLRQRGQSWREDATNRNTAHARNKIRHELLPTLHEYNPAIVETLARTAEVARGEEEFWQRETERLLPLVLLPGRATHGGGRAIGAKVQDGSSGLNMDALKGQPLALQRRIIRAATESLGMALDSGHVESVLAVADASVKACELPDGWRVQRSHRELRFEHSQKTGKSQMNPVDYEYPLPIPGQVAIPAVNLLVHMNLMPGSQEAAAYNRQTLGELSGSEVLCLEAGRLKVLAAADALRVRNLREGDRFRQAHSASEKKVKDLLQDLKVPKDLRRIWPVVSAAGKVIWVRGTRPLSLWFVAEGGSLRRLIIEAEDSMGQQR